MPTRPTTRLAARHLAALLVTLPATGCGAGWQAVGTPWPAGFPPRRQVQVWTAGGPLRLHGVVLTSDSVAGIPFLQPLDCDSCRVALPRTAVDSIRTGDPAGGFWGSTALVLGGALVAVLAFCFLGDRGCPLVGST